MLFLQELKHKEKADHVIMILTLDTFSATFQILTALAYAPPNFRDTYINWLRNPQPFDTRGETSSNT